MQSNRYNVGSESLTRPAGQFFPQPFISPNINFVDDEVFPGNVQKCVDVNLKVLQSILKGFGKFDQTSLRIEEGKTGIKLTTQAEQNGKMLRFTSMVLRN